MSSALRSLLFAISATQVAASCAYGTSHFPRGVGNVPINNFGYDGAGGPTSWHTLDLAANSDCAVGTHQSPIDLVDGVFSEVLGAEFRLDVPDFPNGATFENLGTAVEVLGEGGTLLIPGNNKTFNLAQFHFHLPSEHLDNGTIYAMEVHMVFQTADSEIAVLGTYIDIAKRRTQSSVLLETIFESVGEITVPGTATTTAPLDMQEWVQQLRTTTYKSYSGSLTTPPCAEGVNWFVAADTLSVTVDTYQAARDVIHFNSRFPQGAPGETNVLSTSASAFNELQLLAAAKER